MGSQSKFVRRKKKTAAAMVQCGLREAWVGLLDGKTLLLAQRPRENARLQDSVREKIWCEHRWIHDPDWSKSEPNEGGYHQFGKKMLEEVTSYVREEDAQAICSLQMART